MANKNITPQYQSYGETSARGEQSPMEALTFKVPLTPISKAAARKRKVKVMDEDEYVQKVEKIIERDFFPELEKLKAQSDYMDARDRKDYETMSRLEEKYSGVRPDTGRRMQSPATFDTPLDQPRDTDPRRPQQGQEGDAEGDKQEGAGAEEGKEELDRVILDKFMVNHTSKDNESFIELQVENEMRRNIGRRMRGRGDVPGDEGPADGAAQHGAAGRPPLQAGQRGHLDIPEHQLSLPQPGRPRAYRGGED